VFVVVMGRFAMVVVVMGRRPPAASTTLATLATFGKRLRINNQGQGDSEHSDEGDFA
jgi:hypothetical protein